MKNYYKYAKKILFAWILFSLINILASILFALYLQSVIDITSMGQMEKLRQSCYIGILLVIGLGEQHI